MLCSSSSSSFSSEDGSGSNSDRSSVILGHSEASFVFRAACNSRRSFRNYAMKVLTYQKINTTVTEISHKLLKYFTYPWIYLK